MRAGESPGTAGSCRCCRSRWNNTEPGRSCRRRLPPAGQTVAQHEASGPPAGRRTRRTSDSLHRRAKRRDHSETRPCLSAVWRKSIVAWIIKQDTVQKVRYFKGCTEKIKPLPQQTLEVDHVHHNQTLLLVLLFTQGKIWILLIFGSRFLISTIFVVL